MAGAVYRHQVSLSQVTARGIVHAATAKARRESLQPITVVVLDGGGNLVAAEREDGKRLAINRIAAKA